MFQFIRNSYILNIFKICIIFLLLITPGADAKTALEWFNEGFGLHQTGKLAEAIKAYDEALKINPQLVEAWNGRGVALNDLGRYEEAIKAYDEVLKINLTFPSVWDNKCTSLSNLGKTEESISCYDKALEINPQSALLLNGKKNVTEKSSALGFEMIFAIVALLIIAYLIRKKR